MKIGIIGGGISGLSAAFELGRQGYKVTVFEASPTLGGLGSYLSVGVGYLERYYHHFFTSDGALIQLINDLGLAEKLTFYPAKTGIFRDGLVYPFSSALDVLKFSPLPLSDRFRLGVTTAWMKYAPFLPPSLDQITARAWAARYAGKQAYEVVWGPLLHGKFSTYAESIPALWLWGRIRDRSFKLGYLDGSTKTLFEALNAAIKEQGGTIKLQSPVESIHNEAKGVKVVTPQGVSVFDKVIIAAASPVAARLLGEGLPTHFRKFLVSIDHLGVVCLILTLSHSIQSQYWLNICEPKAPVLVMIEHTNMIDRRHYGGRHVVYLANYLRRNDPRYRMSEKEIIKEYSAFLKNVNPSFDQSWIEDAYLSKTPFAQTIFPIGALERIPPMKLPVPNIYLVNIDQMYPHDRNLNQGVVLGQKVANLIAS